MNKYELTDKVIHVNGATLHRIRALRDIPRYHVKAGDLGGWVEKEGNLSQFGDAWVRVDAVVCGNAKVYDNAFVCGDALVCDNAEVYGNVKICGTVKVCDNACVCG